MKAGSFKKRAEQLISSNAGGGQDKLSEYLTFFD